MTLLAPLAAVVAGAVGGTLLLVMYMLRLRRRPVRVSSILFWGADPKDLEANVPIRMIRPAWTLLLQAAAIALLALALGRPAINADAASSDRLYILIDRSASMSALDSPGGLSRLDAARSEALRIIAGVGGLGGARAMVIPLAARAETATPMTSDRGVLTAAVQELAPTDESGNLASAIDLVSALVASEAGEGSAASGARVVLLSDGAFAEAAPRNIAGAALEYRPVPIAEPNAGPDNLAIVALAARRESDDPARVRVFARLISTRESPTPVTVRFTIDGEELARRAVVVPAAEPVIPGDPAGGERVGMRTPGEHSLALEFARAEGGVMEAGIDRSDLLAADNRAAVLVPPVRRATILIVAPDEPDFFLQSVLEELAPGRVRTTDLARFESATGAELVDAADLIIFDRTAPARTPDAPTLSFGAGLPLPGLRTPVEEEPPGRGATGAVQWDRSHPVLRDVTLESLVVSATLRLETGAEQLAALRGRELATGRDGPLILEVRDAEHTRIVVTFALRASNWPISVGFPIFLSSAVDYLIYGGDPGQGISFGAGDVIPPEALGGPNHAGSISLVDDRGVEVARGSGSIVVPRAGVYTLRGPGASPDAAVPVNMGDDHESLLEWQDRVAIAGDDVAGTAASPRPMELWSWFVLAAAAILAIEWIVYLGVARA